MRASWHVLQFFCLNATAFFDRQTTQSILVKGCRATVYVAYATSVTTMRQRRLVVMSMRAGFF